MTWTAPEVEDDRPQLDMTADERTTLRDWLEMYRATVPLKVMRACTATVTGTSERMLAPLAV